MTCSFELSSNSKKNREGIDPRLIEISDMAIGISMIDFGHGLDSGKRTAARQHELYMDGVSKADGSTVLSNHQSGNALDFYAYVNGAASWEHHHLAMVAAAFLQAANILGYQLSWGGFWSPRNPNYINGIPYGWDCPHVELIG